MPDENEEVFRLDEWDHGDVLAVVEKLDAEGLGDRTRKQAGVVDAVEVMATVAAPAVPVLWTVPLLVLAYKASQRGSSARPAHVALIALSDARELMGRDLLSFPDGGPAVGQVYGRHPVRRTDYLPFASFHRSVLHEKAIEAARYLLSLGARDVEITCRQARGKTGKGEGGITAPDMADVSLTMGFGRNDEGQLAIRVTGAGKRRRVSSDLIWPERDPMFKLANDAALAGAETFHFGLKTEQSGSVNAQAAVRLQDDLRLGLGGDYKRWEDLSLTVDATFGNAKP